MNDFILSLMLMGAMSSGSTIPFWSTSNQYGLMPSSNGGLAMVQAYSQFDESKTLQWKWGASLGANYSSSDTYNLMVDELYGSLRWKKFSLDLGMKHQENFFLASGRMLGSTNTLGSLSTTGGRIIWSGNARTMPGYTLNLEPVMVPYTKGHLFIYGNFGDYKTIDNRWAQGALVHSTRAYLQVKFNSHWDFHAGLDHVAVWGGTMPEGETQGGPITLGNYLRLITGRRAGADGTMSDQLNVLGDHRGSEQFKVVYHNDEFQVIGQYDKPYDDGSGMRLENLPDGVYTLNFGWKDKERWVSDILYEYAYTLYQSGSINGETFDEDGNSLTPEGVSTHGGDSYFNNGQYKSGWSHFGRTIGIPLFYPKEKEENGQTLGIRNNRIKAHHIGIAGKLFRKAPYKLMLTYSQNFGIYGLPYTGENQWQKPWKSVKETPLHQVAGAFMGEVPFNLGRTAGHADHNLALTYGLYADRGQVLEDQLGFSLGVRYIFGK